MFLCPLLHSREQCRILLRKKLDLLCDRGVALWVQLCGLMALRPDPDAGRAAVLRLNLQHLEMVAEEAALKCVETKRKMNKVQQALADSVVERQRLGDLALAAKDVAANDGGVHQPVPLLRMLDYNATRANREHLRSKVVVKRLIELNKRLSDLLYEETLDRQRRLRGATTMRRLLVDQRNKDGLLLVLSDARPDEHWKRVWFGTRAFGGHLHDLDQNMVDMRVGKAGVVVHGEGGANQGPGGQKSPDTQDSPETQDHSSRYVLLGAQWVVMEVLVRPRGTATDTSDVWMRGRFETAWEQEQRTSSEECLLMASEERRTRVVVHTTWYMKQQLKQQRLRQRQERQRLRAENRKIQTQLSLENEARLRLSKLTALARTLGMTVGMRWQDKSGLAPSRPGTAMSRSGGKITLPGEEPAPPAPQAPMAGIPPTWDDLRTTFPLNSSRTVIGGTMDPRRLTQMFAGGKKNRSAGGDDGVVDDSMIPTLLANASRWGLSNSTTQGTTMYTSVFEALKYQVGGRRKNEVHDVMFVAKDIPAVKTLESGDYVSKWPF